MITDKHFIDWENEIFGFGYGSGERPIIQALQAFFSMCKESEFGYPEYDYRILEKEMGSWTTWLLINLFCKSGIIEYGTSPRFGWLDTKGRLLKEYLENKTTQELVDLIHNADINYCYSYEHGCGQEETCNNPLLKQ